MNGHPAARVAIVSLHTSPLDPPGAGDAGGMNVEIRAVAELLSDRGVAVDVFTRCSGRGVPQIEHIAPLARVIQVRSGPCAPVAKDELGPLIAGFGEGIVRAAGTGRYDLVHAHYWLSAPAAAAAADRWDAPEVVSFHTLGEVKNRALADGDPPEPLARLAGEREAVRVADVVVAPTGTEATNLLELYGADPDRVRVVAPGVDHGLFSPRDRAEARSRLGLDERPTVLFLGRLQPLKGPDVAIRAFAEARRRTPALSRGRLLVVGGPSGADGEGTVRRLRELARDEGVCVDFLGPREHAELPWVYAAADVLVMPSRSESFGLTAIEAQACGLPVVATDVGGLSHVVAHGEGGVLVAGAEGFAGVLAELMSNEAERRRLSRGARVNADRFGWDRTVDALLEVYDDLVRDGAAAAAS